jgi:hypothetical protein
MCFLSSAKRKFLAARIECMLCVPLKGAFKLCNTWRSGHEKSQQNSHACVPLKSAFQALQHVEVWLHKSQQNYHACVPLWRLAKHRGLASFPRGSSETRAEKPPILLPGVRLQSPSSPGKVFLSSIAY